ncbi:hypothetical protein [Sporomusa acidovorans]|uniref:Uncharacterized protein n=1 Tax=Sporomusa acidovorans (strain ATCC 49682 / DSM 3132 / Mol) TaxID=1123286 RepID=A0ABZ3J4Q0_SPOA4|nr:hypothetical protein [Sporomusa acidovorans]OZC23955.1 hypothetical protein SPACI_03730 [Sporomusa acidovorans DSM 3132]SDF32094.1 hypothetical protein SAMN04488499_104345 [Sporomusa acidovorans]
MKKFLLTIIFAMLTNVCFAEDIYIVTENGFAKYLRTESLEAKVTTKTVKNSLFEMTYSLICIPDEITLDKLRSQTLNNKISFKKQTFIFKYFFNPNSNNWNKDGSIWVKSDEIWGNSPKKCLYKTSGNMPGGAYYGNESEAILNRDIIITAYQYTLSHKLIKYN